MHLEYFIALYGYFTPFEGMLPSYKTINSHDKVGSLWINIVNKTSLICGSTMFNFPECDWVQNLLTQKLILSTFRITVNVFKMSSLFLRLRSQNKTVYRSKVHLPMFVRLVRAVYGPSLNLDTAGI